MNRTDKRILRAKLLLLKEIEGEAIEHAAANNARNSKIMTQKQLKRVASRVSKVNRAIDLILQRIT